MGRRIVLPPLRYEPHLHCSLLGLQGRASLLGPASDGLSRWVAGSQTEKLPARSLRWGCYWCGLCRQAVRDLRLDSDRATRCVPAARGTEAGSETRACDALELWRDGTRSLPFP